MEKNTSFNSLTNQFLIAMPALMEPTFHRSVAYIFEHTNEGAMGIVINQPLDIQFGEVLSQMKLETKDSKLMDKTVYLGGPVQVERGFVIHSPIGEWENTIATNDNLGVTTSRDIIIEIAKGNSPNQCLVALGYAGWAAGQLEDELANNVWLNGPSNPDIIFDTLNDIRWKSAAATLGVDTKHLSSEIGHA
ncbi:MAG: YqgE/AlgH family protein [Gammaproteobacteria bacterium]|nr:YqgE/AlgH family protein [Gammaproteobacteria bacterium]